MLYRCHNGTHITVATDVFCEYGVSLPSTRSVAVSDLTVMFLMSCQVEVSAPDWSLVQRSCTECGVSEWDREASIVRRPWPTKNCCAMGEKKSLKISSCNFSPGNRWTSQPTEHRHGQWVYWNPQLPPTVCRSLLTRTKSITQFKIHVKPTETFGRS